MRGTSNRTQRRGLRPRLDLAARGAAIATTGLLALAVCSRAQLGVENAAFWRHGKAGFKGQPGEDVQLGRTLATGDFDGDGKPDLAVAAPGASVSGTDLAGAVQVLYGGAHGLQVDAPDDQLIALGYLGAPGETWSGEQFGLGGVAQGDFDHDGYDDLAIASVFDVVDGEGGVGSVLVVPGSANGLVVSEAIYIVGNELPLPDHVEPYRFGHTLASGDFDGDGFADLAVGHRAAVDGASAAGVVNVFFGSPSSLEVGASTQTLHQGLDGLPGTAVEFDLFGSSLSSGDFDGDGRDDLAIGTIADGEELPGAISSGSVTVVYGFAGGLDPGRTSVWIRDLIGAQTSFPQFGQRLASGDFDADGFDDLVASDRWEDVAGNAAVGAVWVRRGGAAGFGPSQRLVPGTSPVPLEPTPQLRLGAELAVADFDGNGRDDLAVSTTPEGPGPFVLQPGTVIVLYSGAGGFDASSSQVFEPSTEGMPGDEADQFGFGTGLAAADLDRDGADDLIAGVALHRNDGRERSGAFVVLPGVDAIGCTPSDTVHCLQGDRFRAEVSFAAKGNAPAAAHAVPALADDSGLFWFFDEDNWEIQVKVLDGCALNGAFWVFSAATTDVEYTLTVTDTETGEVRDYRSPAGAAQAIADTSAFATCLPGAPALEEADPPLFVAPPDACPEKPTELCLHGGRFQLSVEWKAHDGTSGKGKDVPFGTNDSGLFWFFEPDNWELLVKVLDGCAVNGKFWVFSAATTDVEYRLRVYDRVTKKERVYENPAGSLAVAVTDTGAFGGCS